MKQPNLSEPCTQSVAERLELFLDEATSLAAAWFGDTAERERADLIVQMASAMLQREGTDLLTKAVKSNEKENV